MTNGIWAEMKSVLLSTGMIALCLLLAFIPGKCMANELIDAVKSGNTEMVEVLIPVVDDVNARDKRGRTALMYAAGKGLPAVVKMLLDAGADPNMKLEKRVYTTDHVGTAALHSATKSNCLFSDCTRFVEVVSVLTEHPKTDVNIQTEDGTTPIILALANANWGAAEVLLQQKDIHLNKGPSLGSPSLPVFYTLHLLPRQKGSSIVRSTLLPEQKEIYKKLIGKYANLNLITYSNNNDKSLTSPIQYLIRSFKHHKNSFPHDLVDWTLDDRIARAYLAEKTLTGVLHDYVQLPSARLSIVKKLFSLGANPGVDREDGSINSKLLQVAVASKNAEIVKEVVASRKSLENWEASGLVGTWEQITSEHGETVAFTREGDTYTAVSKSNGEYPRFSVTSRGKFGALYDGPSKYRKKGEILDGGIVRVLALNQNVIRVEFTKYSSPWTPYSIYRRIPNTPEAE